MNQIVVLLPFLCSNGIVVGGVGVIVIVIHVAPFAVKWDG
jgi:hypothetical protein